MINEINGYDCFCPNCGNPVEYEEGCIVCYYCGWYEQDKDECTE